MGSQTKNNIADFKKEVISDPSNRDLFEAKVEELKEQISLINDDINTAYYNKAHGDQFADIVIDHLSILKHGLTKQYKKFKLYLDSCRGATLPKQFNIDDIKLVPIASFMDNPPLYVRGNRHKYLCPLHDEDTPSFIVYTDQNTWYCFGCSTGGDNIELYMKLNKCEFKTACSDLSTFG